MVTGIEWVDQEERIFKILIENHKKKPFELWFKDLQLTGGELEDFNCLGYCSFYDKCDIEDRECKTYEILEGNTLSDFCIFMDDNIEVVGEFFRKYSINNRCTYMIPKGYGRDSRNRSSR